MFERFKITREIYAICDAADLNRITVLKLIPQNALNAGVKLLQQRRANAQDSAVFVLTLATQIGLKADPRMLVELNISGLQHAEFVSILRMASEVGVDLLLKRGGDDSMIVFPDE